MKAEHIKHKGPQVVKAPLSPKDKDLPAASGLAECAVELHSIESDLKALQERLEALRYALLTQDNGATDLFALLAGNARRFLTVEELAEVLQVDRRTIYGLRSKGLPFHRVGKELRFDPLEVAEWLKKRQRG